MEASGYHGTPEIINLDDTDSCDSPPAKVPRLDVTIETADNDVEESLFGSNLEFSQSKEEILNNLKEFWESNSFSQCEGDLEIFLNFSGDEMDAACERLCLKSMTEGSLSTACSHIVSASDIISYNNCVKFLTFTLQGKVKALCQNASRTLASTVTLMAETFPKQLTDAVFVPCIYDGILAPQSDLICKILKETIATGSRSYVFQKLIEKGFLINEHTVLVLQTLVDKKSELDSCNVARLFSLLQGAAKECDKNLKFGKLLVAIVNGYGKLLTDDGLVSLQHLADRHNTFMKKSLQAAVKKLKHS